ncbi:hypothetical protein FRC11_008068 [Ceratobasidium sp. 423]|nr:hypothetical protein FRC11_008068 [Ceratobasidium sp. 423]
MRNVSTPVQAHVPWENESLDSIRSDFSGISLPKQSPLQPPLSTPVPSPAPGANISLPVTDPWQAQQLANNVSHGTNTSTHHATIGVGSLDSILSQTPSSAHRSVSSHTSARNASMLRNFAQKTPVQHSTQPRVETTFYPISEVKLEESSDSDSELDLKDCSIPKPVTWTMQDYETQQYTDIWVSAEQYSHLFQQALALQSSTIWDDHYHEDNPICSLKSCGFLETATVDWVALYLQQLVYHSPNLDTSVFITVPSANQALRLHPDMQPDFPWLSSTPPGRMLIPIVDHAAKHYYMYHVVFGELDNNPPAYFYYIDSLGRAPTEEVELKRDSFTLELVKRMLPFCQEVQEWEWDTVEWRQGCPPNFRQAPGSLDCGLFVCQALSALTFDHCFALENTLPVADVRSRLVWLMAQLGSGHVQLGSRSSPPVWLLPLHEVPHETPSSLDNYLDCPGPLLPLTDVFPVAYKREWPLPNAPWETKHISYGLVEIKSTSSVSPTAPTKPPILGSPFQLVNQAARLPTHSSSSSSHSALAPTFQSFTPPVSLPRYLSGKPRLENPFLKRNAVASAPKSNSAPHKAKSNPFARTTKGANTNSKHGLISNSVTKLGATGASDIQSDKNSPAKQYQSSTMPDICASPPILTRQPATPDIMLVPTDALDNDFANLSPFAEPVLPQFKGIPSGTSTKVSSPPPQDIGQVKEPLHQMQLAFSSPATEGGAPKLTLHRPPLAASNASQTQPSSSTMSGMTFAYGKQAPFQFPPPHDQRFAKLFHDLSLPSTEHQPGFVYGTKRRNAEDIYKFTAAEPEMDRSAGEEVEAGIKVYRRPDGSHDQDTTIGMSITQFCAFVDSLQDPDTRHKAILTGTKPDGTPIVLNWLKDSLPVDRHWLALSADFDSMSITMPNPVFTTVVNVTPWPDRGRTLTNNIGIEIFHDGKARPIRNNNHVRLNVFFPNYEVDRISNKHYKTYVKTDVYELWYNDVFLGALDQLLANPPPNLRSACLHLKQDLPQSYKVASAKSIGPNQQGKIAKQYPISPEIMNLLLPLMRRIVDSKPHLAFMRGFFFHIFGMNLKTAAQSIPGREGDNAMGHTINTYPVIDFNKANPDDMVFDYGVEVMVDPSKLPDTVQHATLLWNQAKALPIIAPNWNSPRIDAFCGSFVVGGFASNAPAKARRSGIIRTQAYPKCKNETYSHRDRSTGTSFSPLQAMNNDQAFRLDMKQLRDAWVAWCSFGVRFEYRMIAWAAMVAQGVPLEQLLDNLLLGEAIVAHPTPNVVRFKETLRRNYVEILARTQALPQTVREDTSATSMVAIISHCIKSLVKRPDDQSTSRQLVTRFHLALRSHNYGYFSIPPEALCADLARVDSTNVPTQDLGIHDYMRRKAPAGARVKTSRRTVGQDALQADDLPGPTNTTTQGSIHQQHTSGSQLEGGSNWMEEDQKWLENFINKEFALCLWDYFPGRRTNPEYSLMQKPFSNKQWSQIARPNVTKEPLVKGGNLFSNKVDIFFPESLRIHHDSPQWKAYQTRILNKLRQRAKAKVPEDLNGYYTKLRDAIFQILLHWHFLPCPSTRAIWTYSGTGETKVYRVVSNPNVAS